MSDARKTVGVLGGGRWGEALATAVQRTGKSALLCTRRQEEHERLRGNDVETTRDMGELAKRCTLILMAVPSDVVRPVSRQLGDVLDGAHLLVHGVRGLSGEGLAPVSAVIRDETPCRRVGALGGPALADEIIAGRPGVIAAASHYPEVTSAVSEALAGPLMRVSCTHDLVGLEWASALNGCLFVALGYARAIGLNAALTAGLLLRGVHEAARVGVAAGADEKTFFSLAGIGDVMAAMGQDDRPECRLGAALAKGKSLDEARVDAGMRVEAITLAPRVLAFARERRIDAALFESITLALSGKVSTEEILARLMVRR